MTSDSRPKDIRALRKIKALRGTVMAPRRPFRDLYGSGTRVLVTLFAVLACLLCVGCGGGTTGTGDEVPRYQLNGRVVDQQRQPVAGVEVSAPASQQTTMTDATGAFLLDVPETDSTLTLQLRDARGTALVVLDDLPGETATLQVALQIDTSTPDLVVTEVSVRVSDQPSSDGSSTIQGQLLQESEAPIVGAEVALDGNTTKVRTDRTGAFSLKMTPPRESAQLFLTFPGKRGRLTVTLRGLPLTPSLIAVTLVVRVIDTGNGDVSFDTATSADQLEAIVVGPSVNP